METVNTLMKDVSHFLGQSEFSPKRASLNRRYAANYADSCADFHNSRCHNAKGERVFVCTRDREFLEDVDRYHERQNNWTWGSTNLFAPCCEPTTFFDPNVDLGDASEIKVDWEPRRRARSMRSLGSVEAEERMHDRAYSEDSSPSSTDSWMPASVSEALDYMDFFFVNPSKFDKKIKNHEKNFHLPQLIRKQTSYYDIPEHPRLLSPSVGYQMSSRKFAR